MVSKLLKLLKVLLILAVVLVLGLIGVRTYDVMRGQSLSVWHKHVPHDVRAGEISKLDWAGYLKAEQALFEEVRAKVVERIEPDERFPANRYFEGSPVYPGRFKADWNRSYLLMPDGKPIGAVVLLHGLTDSPYSLRHVARLYRERGFVAVAIRLPAHGTVPAALTDVDWEDWAEATRLAVREAKRLTGPAQPLHLVGFSNGGALAMKYALDAIGEPGLAKPDRLILISPMIGITAFARFAGVFGWPAVFPAFANAAWLSIVTEFNPFKYNSFPINGARQSSLLTRALQEQITTYARENRLGGLAPVLTFQSVVDFTVSTRAVITALYEQLPANGSELVLFDVNRNAKLSPLLRSSFEDALERLAPQPPLKFRLTVVANAAPKTSDVVARITNAGASASEVHPLTLTYPPEVYSLSHVAVPFPMNDALYGMRPDDQTDEDFGVSLGTMAARGEVGLLVVTLDSLIRASSNPFFPYMLDRIAEDIPKAGGVAEAGKPR
ncbi:MAG: alpha/beta hydrolase [Burkholderiales bacterium]|jgi:alpha-beta hydrolase superfamily lysophospholipase|nr:alpha/beta hydrolase [Burkholderiales bacterium]